MRANGLMPMELSGLTHTFSVKRVVTDRMVEWAIENLIAVQFRDYALKSEVLSYRMGNLF